MLRKFNCLRPHFLLKQHEEAVPEAAEETTLGDIGQSDERLGGDQLVALHHLDRTNDLTLLERRDDGLLDINHGLEIGALTAMITYVMQILMSVMMASFLAMMAPRATVCAERICEVLDTETSVRATSCTDDVQQLEGSMTLRQTIPVAGPGPLTLLYPKFLPGNHAATGPIQLLAGLTVTADGRRIEWLRDTLDPYAFHLDIPAGVTSIEHGTYMDDEAIALFKKNGAWYVPTISAGRFVAARLAGGQLSIHGWVYCIETSEILAYDAGTGRFAPLDGDGPLPVATPAPRYLQA